MRAEEDKTRSSFDLIHCIEKAICCPLAAALRERQVGIKGEIPSATGGKDRGRHKMEIKQLLNVSKWDMVTEIMAENLPKPSS